MDENQKIKINFQAQSNIGNAPSAFNPTASKSKKNIFIILLILAAISVGGYLFWQKNSQKKATSVATISEKDQDALTVDGLLPGLPKDAGTSNAEYFTLTSRNNTTTYYISITRKNTVTESFNLYNKYFTENGWTIANLKNAANSIDQAFTASKGSSSVSFQAVSPPAPTPQAGATGNIMPTSTITIKLIMAPAKAQ